MELRVYDAEMDFKGLIENQRSIIWTRKYGSVGNFRIYVPITEYNVSLFKLGRLVWMRDAVEAGVIEDITLRQNNLENEIEIKGRFLESYMDRRLIRPTFNFSGTVENAMHTILSNAVAIPRVILEAPHGLAETVTFQATYKNLLTYMEKLAKGAGYGFRFRPDFTSKIITFEVFVGKDHTIQQADRARVIFSEKYENLHQMSMNTCDSMEKTVAYVGGEGEGSERVYVVAGDDSLVGLERRELFVDARQVRSENLSQDQYREALIRRGVEELESNSIAESIEFSTGAVGNFEYKKHYDLGDIVTAKKESWGVSKNMRVSEVMEVYQYGRAQVNLTLGSPIPEKIDWEDR